VSIAELSPQVMESTQAMRLPGERNLVRRLDIFLMTFGCISQGEREVDSITENALLTLFPVIKSATTRSVAL
jgi:hypothetical protein